MKKTPTQSSLYATRKVERVSTRSLLLDTAGQIFAERGYAETTSKEICEAAGANMAAVNYYFGSKEKLYEEVLVAAHLQMMSLDTISHLISSPQTPEQKLYDFLDYMLHTALISSNLWGIKIFLRELVTPTATVNKVLDTAVLPKAEKLRDLICAVTGLPLHSEQVQRATAFVVIPCVSLILFPEIFRNVILPGKCCEAKGLLQDMHTYVWGGLQALAKEHEPPIGNNYSFPHLLIDVIKP